MWIDPLATEGKEQHAYKWVIDYLLYVVIPFHYYYPYHYNWVSLYYGRRNMICHL